MKNFTLVFMLSLPVFLQAQLNVKNDSYVYNKNSLICVTTYVNLENDNSYIYLRNEGQLLQKGTTVGGVNSGIGKLSVFQEGTSNQYGYNYWCSPVGVGVSGAGNNPFSLNPVINRPYSNILSSLPTYTSGYDGSSTDTSLTISTYWIYKYTTASSYSQWFSVGQTGTVNPGLGFTMKGVGGTDFTDVGETALNNPSIGNQRYDFRGKPNEGTIEIPVLAPTVGTQYPNSTLTGNPYPSAINLNYFLLENSGYNVDYETGAVTSGGSVNVINGNAYFWEHTKTANSHILVNYIGGYGTYVPNNSNANSPGTYNNAVWNTYNADGGLNVSGGLSTTDRYKRMFTPVGQGFLVKGFANGNALMKNVYRTFVKEGVATNSQFERTSSANQTNENQNWDEIPNVAGVDYTQFSRAEVPQIKIHTIINNQITKEVTIAFNPNAQDGYENAFDAQSSQTLPNDAYLSIMGDPKPYVISTLPFTIDKRILFTVKATQGCSFKVHVGNIINFNGSENVYLYDRLTDLYHDIKNASHEMVLPAGLYNNRFLITFKNSSLGTETPSTSNFIITQNNSTQTATVHNPNLFDVESIKLFDLTGKLVLVKESLGIENSFEFSTSGLAESIYMVQVLTTDNKKMVQKIIVTSK